MYANIIGMLRSRNKRTKINTTNILRNLFNYIIISIDAIWISHKKTQIINLHVLSNGSDIWELNIERDLGVF